MNDTQRLDAIGEYGLMVSTYDELQNGQWYRTWICRYGDGGQRAVAVPTIREAIDAAVLDIRTINVSKH